MFARRTFAFLLTLSCVFVSNGQLLDLLSFLAEGPLAQFMDANVQPPPRTTGFNTLVPQESIRLHCANSSTSSFQEIFLGDVNTPQKINFSQPLTIVIHGWTEHSNLTQYNNLTARYRRFVNNTNYCLLDWKPYAAFTYQIAARQGVPLVAQYLFGFLQYLSVIYFPLAKVSLVGFSMGGQIAGLTGKSLSGRIGTIYALDPAGPLFTLPFDVGTNRRLTKTDAQYVQVIYTSRFAIGMGPIVGHQNFLPNRGYHPQPSCQSLVTLQTGIQAIRCSHEYAVSLFTATLDPANVVMAQKCTNIFGVLVCWGGLLPKDRVGIYAQRLSGDFYL